MVWAVDRMQVLQDKDELRALLGTAMNYRGSIRGTEYLD
jgi:hypothetical protein